MGGRELETSITLAGYLFPPEGGGGPRCDELGGKKVLVGREIEERLSLVH